MIANDLDGYARRGKCLVGYVTSLKCRGCSRETEIGPYNVCDYCFGPLEVVYDYEAMRPSITREAILNGPRTMWRYKDLLPVETDQVENHRFQPIRHLHRLSTYRDRFQNK